VQEFQQQTETLEYLERELILRHQAPTDERLHHTFNLVQSLAHRTDQLLNEHDLLSQVGNWDIVERIQAYKRANLRLFHLYAEKESFAERDRLLWGILRQRITMLPDELRGRINSLFTEILLWQFGRGNQEQPRRDPAVLRARAEEVLNGINKPPILHGIQAIIDNIENNYEFDQKIRQKEEFLAKISADFERLIRLAVAAVSGKVISRQAHMGNVLICLSLFSAFLVVLGWRLTHKYSTEFLEMMQFAISSVRQKRFDFELGAVSDDEFGDQLIFVKEMAGSIEESLEQLTLSEQRFRSMVENISDWIWLIDADYKCTYSSPQGAGITGIPEGEMVGCSVRELIGVSAKIGPLAEPFLHKILAHQPFDAFNHVIINRDGGEREFETSGRPVFTESGDYHGYRFSSRDISDARKAERSIKENALLQQFHNKILGLSLLDLDLDEIFRQFLELVLAPSWLGLEPAGVIFLVDASGHALKMRAHKGLDLQIPISCDIVPFGVCLCGRAAQTGKVVFSSTIDERHEVTFEGIHLHGHYCVPIHSVAGEIIGVFTAYLKEGSIRDPRVELALNDAVTVLGGIIKRRQAEEALQRLNAGLEEEVAKRTDQLTSANKELDTFAYSVSHDLRAPLRAIDGFSLALLEDYGDKIADEGRDYIDRLRNGCVRMGQLIDDILKLSRLTRCDIKRQPLNLSRMAAEVIDILSQGDSSRQVEFLVAPDLQASADPVMTRAVLDNLLGNAWKYTAKVEAARIEMAAQEMDGKTVYYVRDNGVGFDMSYSDKLFTAFQRLHSEAEFEGSGIGLATVKRIIQRHEGKIWAEAEEGKGACFYFSLSC